jgi:hypothetical protein
MRSEWCGNVHFFNIHLRHRRALYSSFVCTLNDTWISELRYECNFSHACCYVSDEVVKSKNENVLWLLLDPFFLYSFYFFFSIVLCEFCVMSQSRGVVTLSLVSSVGLSQVSTHISFYTIYCGEQKKNTLSFFLILFCLFRKEAPMHTEKRDIDTHKK